MANFKKFLTIIVISVSLCLSFSNCEDSDYSSSGTEQQGGNGGNSGGSSSTDITDFYDIKSISVKVISVTSSGNASASTKTMYKWTHKETGKIWLNSSSYNFNYAVGPAKRNTDSECYGYSVRNYDYKITEYAVAASDHFYYFD